MTLFPAVPMPRISRLSKGTQLDVVSRLNPFTKVPLEIITEIFKFVVLSSEEARSHEVKTLCLVDKYWNNIANATSDLWTKVTLTYPLHADQLSAAQKWLRASEPKVVDVEVNLCDPTWCWLEESWFLSVDSLQNVIGVLSGTEHRWRSISVKSDAQGPIRKFLRGWVTPSLPALESISFENFTPSISQQRLIEWPALFGGNGALMPKLQEVTICEVPLDWTPAATSFRNLRKLVIRNQPHEDDTTFEQFSALLAASPRLETLDIRGYYPTSGDSHTQAQIPLVHLPALKHLVFGWSHIDLACNFLTMFQIPETLETLCLAEAECKFKGDVARGEIDYKNNSPILNLLANLGAGNPKDKDPSSPWISMLGLKSLSVSWVYSDTRNVIAFLQNAPMIEEICLEDVADTVLEAIATLSETLLPSSLKRVDIRWRWGNGSVRDEPRLVVERLRGLGLEVTVGKYVGKRRGHFVKLDA